MNPSKLKVVELRAELASRGLDTKGNKAALVERLQEALDQESGTGKIIRFLLSILIHIVLLKIDHCGGEWF